MSYLRRSISMLDIIFNTQEYKDYCATMADLERQQEQLKEDYERNRAELKQAKKDFKEHRKEEKKAEREAKKVRRRHQDPQL